MLLDAAYAVVKEYGRPVDASALRVLVENDSALSIEPDHVFKVWPTGRDQGAFRHAMRERDDPVGVEERLGALTRALRERLRLVVIDLEPGDNAQVIFETLTTAVRRCWPQTSSRT